MLGGMPEASGISTKSDFVQPTKLERSPDGGISSVKEDASASKNVSPTGVSPKLTEKKNIHYGAGKEKYDPNANRDANLNQMNKMDNGQYAYTEVAEADTNFTGGLTRNGVPSLFNNYAIFIHSLCNDLNSFKDVYESEGVFRHVKDKKELTLVALLDEFSPTKTITNPYYANDFLYAKYYNKIPLSHLITLRRFPFPTYDNLEFADEGDNDYRPISQAVTYFGEPTGNSIGNILSINGKINWKNVSAQVWDVESTPDKSYEDSKQALSLGKVNSNNVIAQTINVSTGAMNKTSDKVGMLANIINGKGDLSGVQGASLQAARSEMDFSYTHKVYGPINVIKDTMTRDTGIGASLEFDLTFEYQLKSYNGINPKLAFLDLIGNLMALTYYHAKWWGGANRFFPKPMSQFGFLGDQKSFYSGDYGKYFSSIGETLKSAGVAAANGFQQLLEAIVSGNFNALANMIFNTGKKVLDIRSKKSRPNVVAVHSLVNGSPVGEYHCVIGDPTNPIATIGNLVCTDFRLTFGEQLGFDGFPDSLKLVVSLKKARPMDSGDIQSIFNLGYGRTYVPEKGVPDVVNNVSNSKQPAAGTKGTRNKSAKGLEGSFGTAN